jgi:cation/acetate symporter
MSLAAILGVCVVAAITLGLGAFGLRLSRTTSDFYVASRSVGARTNAAAISGEYLSAASFLGIAGLVAVRGADMLWYPIGWTAGYLLLLMFVAAPLRRSRAYTLADFTEFRLESSVARTVASSLVVLIAVLYLIPQFRGAGLTLSTLTGAPEWVGSGVVAAVVLLNVVVGGMRSITLVQAVQYWLKLAALLIPLAVLLAFAHGGAPGARERMSQANWLEPMQGRYSEYLTYSLITALFLGAMGLPHVVVRFYTNRDGAAARRTTLSVLLLLGAFYVLPPIYGVLGRRWLPGVTNTDAIVLSLPSAALHGVGGDILTGVLAAGAFAAFLSTSSGLVLSVAGVLGQDVLGRRLAPVAGFRVAAIAAAAGTLILTLATAQLAVARGVELAFAVAASTFCPLLLLGIWWRRLTAPGAIAGLLVGAAMSSTAVVAAMAGWPSAGALGAVFAQPALVTVPTTFLTMIGVSLATPGRVPAGIGRIMVRLHVPEEITLDRGDFRARGAES